MGDGGIKMAIIVIIQMIALAIQIFCFIPVVSDKAKRQYGRWFNTRIDSPIWHQLTLAMCLVVISLSLLAQIWRIV